MEGMGLQVGQAAQPQLRLISNKELDARAAAEKQQLLPAISSLAGHLKILLERAKEVKSKVQQEILNDLNARNGIYPDAKLAEIREFGGSEIFMMLSNNKCRAVEAHFKDIFVPDNGEQCWSMDSTPMPELPEEEQMKVIQQVMMEAEMLSMSMQQPGMPPIDVDFQALVLRTSELNEQIKKQLKQEAKEGAERMGRVIEDQFVEGNWKQALLECLYYLSTTKACILKGPIVKRRKKMSWAKNAQGKTVPQVIEGYKIEWEARSPLDIYPLSDTTNMQNGGFFDRYQLSIQDLSAMRGMKGVDENALNAVIEQYGRAGLKTIEVGDQQRANVEQRPYSNWSGYSTAIEGWLFWGAIPGFLLQEWCKEMPALLAKVPNKYEAYEVSAWLIGSYVVKLTINEHPLGRRPYSKSSFEKLPGSFWGRGPAELLKDIQDMCNALARAIVNNTAFASGPMVAINDSSRIPEGENVDDIYPFKVFQFTKDKGGATGHRPPIEFFMPTMVADKLMLLYRFFDSQGDTIIGMPSYPMGELDNAAASTASGMSMALNQSGKGTKSVVKNIDLDLIDDAVMRMYEFNMLYNPDESIKRDLVCVPRGSSTMLVKEHLQMRRQEFLDRTNNPLDIQIMTPEGRMNVLAEVAKSLDMPVDKIIPYMDDMKMQKELMNATAAPGGAQQPKNKSSKELDGAGSPVSGQDTAVFNQQSKRT